MNITVLGSGGNVGSRIVAEALSRGHEVTAVVRSPADFERLPAGVNVRSGDVGDTSLVAELAKGQDVLISAIRPPQGREELLPILTKSILDGAALADTPTIVVGGAASLKIQADAEVTVLDAPDFLPASVLPIARACAQQFELIMTHDSADWTYICPPAQLTPGERKGRYRLGTDHLVLDAEGKSSISMEDFAVAILDEAETPKHSNVRFTVGY